MSPRPSPRAEDGFSLVQVVAITAVMLILMSAGIPTWRYVMQDAREEELIFRGIQIAEAVERYQRKNGNAPPPSLDVLVKGKFLRKAYKDPMTRDGKWRFVRPGEVQGGGTPAPRPSGSPAPEATPAPSGGPVGGIGAVMGVASTSNDKSLRSVNGKTRYNEWVFAAGQQVKVGETLVKKVPGAPTPGGNQQGASK